MTQSGRSYKLVLKGRLSTEAFPNYVELLYSEGPSSKWGDRNPLISGLIIKPARHLLISW